MSGDKPDAGSDRLDRAVARARAERAQREHGYRDQALKMYPWVCGRCGREFTRETVHLLTVHHRDHDHDHNPPDGNNWELLCLYCHDNEHARMVHAEDLRLTESGPVDRGRATHKPFAGLGGLLERKPGDEPPGDDGSE